MRKSAMLMLFLALGLAVPAHAQMEPLVKAKVPFAFRVGDTQLTPGTYEAFVEGIGADTITVRNLATGKAAFALTETRLSERPGPATIVFDKMGNDRYLSEIHPAGDDGYLLHSAASKKHHTHEQVVATGSSKKK